MDDFSKCADDVIDYSTVHQNATSHLRVRMLDNVSCAVYGSMVKGKEYDVAYWVGAELIMADLADDITGESLEGSGTILDDQFIMDINAENMIQSKTKKTRNKRKAKHETRSNDTAGE